MLRVSQSEDSYTAANSASAKVKQKCLVTAAISNLQTLTKFFLKSRSRGFAYLTRVSSASTLHDMSPNYKMKRNSSRWDGMDSKTLYLGMALQQGIGKHTENPKLNASCSKRTHVHMFFMKLPNRKVSTFAMRCKWTNTAPLSWCLEDAKKKTSEPYWVRG